MTPEYSAKPPAVSANGWLAFAVALVVVLVDQGSKAWIVHGLHLHLYESIRLLPVLSLTGVHNIGVTFGMLRADTVAGRSMLSLFALAVVVVLALWGRRAERRLMAVAFGLVIGGAIGNNLIDRVRLGYVIDFIDVSGLGFFPWVFNVADVCIDVGVGLLAIDALWPRAKASAHAAPET